MVDDYSTLSCSGIPLKQCIRCRKSFPASLDYFFFSPLHIDGLQRQCQPCQRAKRLRNKRYREGHPEACRAAVHEANKKRFLLEPEVVRAVGRTKAKRYYRKHTEVCRIRSSVYRAANPERIKATQAVWSKEHPEHNQVRAARRRARLAGSISDMSAAQRKEIKAHYHYRCVYCRKKFTSKNLHLDHITPVIKQGPDTLWNYVPACKSCNSKKKDGPPLTPVQPLLLTIALPKRRKL